MEVNNFDVGGVVIYEVGIIEKILNLYFLVSQLVCFCFKFVDVIYLFWVLVFYFKMDVILGYFNQFDFILMRIGVYDGKCVELCGIYYVNMIFKVYVVLVEDYNKYFQQFKVQGDIGEIKFVNLVVVFIIIELNEGEKK